jgi:hypothetical protein
MLILLPLLRLHAVILLSQRSGVLTLSPHHRLHHLGLSLISRVSFVWVRYLEGNAYRKVIDKVAE